MGTQSDADPFTDPEVPRSTTGEILYRSHTSNDCDVEAVFQVEGATLTLAPNGLIVEKRSEARTCGIWPLHNVPRPHAIPFYNVLDAGEENQRLIIRYAVPNRAKTACRATVVDYRLCPPNNDKPEIVCRWTARLLARAYPPGSPPRRRYCVLINPVSGRGDARKSFRREVEPLLIAAHASVTVHETTHRGHAAEFAEALPLGETDVLLCVGGDGLCHEAFNGLARRADRPAWALRRLTVAQIPCGSGNALAMNSFGTNSPSLATLAAIKAVRTRLDLLAITQAGRLYFSFLSQAVGIVAESDLGTEHLRWMGESRFTYGIVSRLLRKTAYPARVSYLLDTDDKAAMQAASLPPSDSDLDQDAEDLHGLPALQHGTVQDELPESFQSHDLPGLGNLYIGNMCWMAPSSPFFPAAQLADGRADLLTISASLPFKHALGMLATVPKARHFDDPQVGYRKVHAFRVEPRSHARAPWRGRSSTKEGAISIDGEAQPFAPFQGEVLPSVATVLCRREGMHGVEGWRK